MIGAKNHIRSRLDAVLCRKSLPVQETGQFDKMGARNIASVPAQSDRELPMTATDLLTPEDCVVLLVDEQALLGRAIASNCEAMLSLSLARLAHSMFP
jgi:hypothetical protein